MEQTELKGTGVSPAILNRDIAMVKPQDCAVPAEQSCPTCSGNAPAKPISYVYAIGHVQPRFCTLGAEKEFAQAAARSQTAGKTDQQVLHDVLSKRENHYLARQLRWVFSVQGLETYILHPRDGVEFDSLVDSVRSLPSPDDIAVIIGVKGPIAPPELCNGLMIPIVVLDQLYYFSRDELINAVPRNEDVEPTAFKAAALEVFERIVQMTDNFGATDKDRVMNYSVMRDMGMYHVTAKQFGRDFALTGVDVRSSPLSGVRNIANLILEFTNRKSGFVEKFSASYDVTEEFPFKHKTWGQYFDR